MKLWRKAMLLWYANNSKDHIPFLHLLVTCITYIQYTVSMWRLHAWQLIMQSWLFFSEKPLCRWNGSHLEKQYSRLNSSPCTFSSSFVGFWWMLLSRNWTAFRTDKCLVYSLHLLKLIEEFFWHLSHCFYTIVSKSLIHLCSKITVLC